MVCYQVYLEIADDGRCLAHVPALPGCIARAATRADALQQLPEAIRDHHAWLRRHGEDAPPPEEPVTIEVAGESVGSGPFDPGDPAALLPPDRDPLGCEEMEQFFRLMAHSRGDMLLLVHDASDELLDWQPAPGAFTLRSLLRHVGNVEEWYVSRLVSPETLPPEWEEDEALPLFEFLEMERRTALARLRQLSAEERSAVYHPTSWTDHPDEAWTARKGLRRAVEHERQHTAQARRILRAYRQCLLARLAAERARLLEACLYMDQWMLAERTIHSDWTVVDVLAHVAAWDRWEERTMCRMAAGEEPDLSLLKDLDAANAAFVREWRGRSLDEVLLELSAAREDWVAWLESLTEETFYRPRSYGGGDWSFTVPVQVQWEHDARHAEQIADWREKEGLKGVVGAKAVLRAALDAARKELLRAAALVSADQQASRPVCGRWTLQDVLGHVADWEFLGAEGLGHMAKGVAPQVEHVQDIDAWNEAHVQARRDQPWEKAWQDIYAARRALLGVLEGMSQDGLGRRFPFPWGSEGTPYQWVGVYVAHDRTHARGLWAATETLPTIPAGHRHQCAVPPR